MKKHLTREEEFQILKIVLDKFLWFGVVIMAFGFYKMIVMEPWYGLILVMCGAFLMLIFMWMLVREYNYMK